MQKSKRAVLVKESDTGSETGTRRSTQAVHSVLNTSSSVPVFSRTPLPPLKSPTPEVETRNLGGVLTEKLRK